MGEYFLKEIISQDSFATVLLCAYVMPQEKIENGYKPLSQKEWVNLSVKIVKSNIARPANLFKLTLDEICSELRISFEEASRLIVLLSRAPLMALQIEKYASMGISVLTRADSTYPKRFKKILKGISPNILYVAGDLEILNSESIGFVGSRKPLEESGIFTEEAVKKAVSEGYTIISGGSKGIDSIAHKTATESNGKTIAILSDGLISFLKKKENINNILNKQMLVISPYHPNARFYAYTALERNKYIYSLSNLVIVAASDYRKGGTWSGAIENLENKWVPLYVMQSDASKGLEELHKMGVPRISQEDLRSINFATLCTGEESITKEDKKVGIFELVWPFIDSYIHKPASIIELSKELDIEINQLNTWFRKAKELGKIEYINGDKVVSSVFYNKELDREQQLNFFE